MATVERARSPKLALQIRVAWGDAVLDVVRIEPARPVRVGELPYAHVLDGPAARAFCEVPLRPGARGRVSADALTFDLEIVETEPSSSGAKQAASWAPVWPLLVSAALHVSTLAGLAWLRPSLKPDADAETDRDRMLALLAYLDAAALREHERPPPPQVLGDDPRSEHGDLPYAGGTGTRAVGEEGTAGQALLAPRSARFAVKGRVEEEIGVARELALREAATQVGLVATMMGADPHTTPATWGVADANGTDAADLRGAMWGDAQGEGFGAGGLGLTGSGEGGGGLGAGVGLGNLGTLGHGIGTGKGTAVGPGHMVGSPGIRVGMTSVDGRLPPEAIQRVVRQSFGRFRLCYENALRTHPTLEGGVTVRFLIARSGAVSLAEDGGSSLPDPATVACVVRSFGALSFPAPEGGTVTVVYPLALSPQT